MDLITGIDGTLTHRIDALETRLLKETLIRNRWNKTQTAMELGLSRVGLRNKIERFDLKTNSNMESVET